MRNLTFVNVHFCINIFVSLYQCSLCYLMDMHIVLPLVAVRAWAYFGSSMRRGGSSHFRFPTHQPESGICMYRLAKSQRGEAYVSRCPSNYA